MRGQLIPAALRDEQVQQMLYEWHDIRQVMERLHAKVRSSLLQSGVGPLRGADGTVSGLDSASMREILDHLFGEHDGAQLAGIGNWAHACDYSNFTLYLQLTEGDKANNMEVRRACAPHPAPLPLGIYAY
jgi:hypothetical protein